MARAVPWAVARRDSTGDQSRAPAWRARPVQGPGLTGGETFSTMQPQHECPVAACDLHAHHALTPIVLSMPPLTAPLATHGVHDPAVLHACPVVRQDWQGRLSLWGQAFQHVP